MTQILQQHKYFLQSNLILLSIPHPGIDTQPLTMHGLMPRNSEILISIPHVTCTGPPLQVCRNQYNPESRSVCLSILSMQIQANYDAFLCH